jgi:hypothetical protein
MKYVCNKCDKVTECSPVIRIARQEYVTEREDPAVFDYEKSEIYGDRVVKSKRESRDSKKLPAIIGTLTALGALKFILFFGSYKVWQNYAGLEQNNWQKMVEKRRAAENETGLNHQRNFQTARNGIIPSPNESKVFSLTDGVEAKVSYHYESNVQRRTSYYGIAPVYRDVVESPATHKLQINMGDEIKFISLSRGRRDFSKLTEVLLNYGGEWKSRELIGRDWQRAYEDLVIEIYDASKRSEKSLDRNSEENCFDKK